MKAKLTFPISLLLLLTFFSCDTEPIIEEPTLTPTDCWTEIEPESIFQFAGSNHIFCFLNDAEFTLQKESWTDIVVDINDPTQWTDYIKGTYVFDNESFEVEGNYMDADFENLGTSHFGATDFDSSFEVKVVSETEMILDNNDDQPHLGIRLVQ